jgi:hypothetical protein
MSNLLDKASVILTPTAYNNGEALCVKPSDGSGDFDFSRNSAATRVNAQGLVENVQILSSNLVQNGDFSEEGSEEVSNGSFSQEGAEVIVNGDFSNGNANWTISGGNAEISNGKLNLSNAATYGTSINNSAAVVSGKTYLVEYTISDYVGGSSQIRLGSQFGTSRNSNGTFSEYIVANDTLIRLYPSSSNTTLSIDNVSVREVGQDWDIVGTGWSFGEDKIVSVNGSNYGVHQSAIVSGKTYKITYEVKDYVSGNFSIRANTVNGSVTASANGTYTDYITSNGTFLRLMGNGTFNGSVTNISVKEVGQNWTLGSGWEIGDSVATKSGTDLSYLTQSSLTSVVGKTYNVKASITNVTTGNVRIDNFTSGTTYTSDTEVDVIYTATTAGAFRFLGWSGFDGTITNISVLEITDDTNLPRINYEGFSYQDALGSEQIVNGGFTDGSANWSVGSNSEINNGSARIYSPSGGYTFISQSNVLTIGKTYLISLEIVEQNLGEIRLSDGSGYLSNSFSGVGIHTFKSTSLGTILRIQRTASITDITIDNVSVKEYLGQSVVPNSGCGSWLWEPQSTNLITYSSDYTNWWINTGTTDVISSTMLSPNGLDYSTLLVGDVATASTKRIRNTVTPIASTAHTFSIFVKSANRTYIQIINSGDAQGYANFDVSNGIVGNTGSKTTANITPLNNNWYRCEVSTDATTINGGFMIYLVDSNTASFAASGTSTDGVYIWGAQLEQQSYATSYIPTNGEANGVTRNQDVCTNGGSLATINSTEGVLYAEIAALANDSTTRFVGLNDGSNSNRVVILYFNSANKIRAIVSSGGTKYVDVNYQLTNVLDFHKVAIKYSLNDFALWIDGVEVATDTTLNAPIGLDRLDFLLSGANNFFGKTKALAVWKEALSDAELTELTTI